MKALTPTTAARAGMSRSALYREAGSKPAASTSLSSQVRMPRSTNGTIRRK